jgi:hypothetical protein
MACTLISLMLEQDRLRTVAGKSMNVKKRAQRGTCSGEFYLLCGISSLSLGMHFAEHAVLTAELTHRTSAQTQ